MSRRWQRWLAGRGAARYRRAWDDYSRRFRGPGTLGDEWGGPERADRLFERHLQPWLEAQSHVVEIGPGGGRFTRRVAPRVRRLTLADVSPRMLRRAQRAAAGLGVIDAQQLTGLDLWPLRGALGEGRVDLIFGFDVFLHLDLGTTLTYLEHSHAVLRPGGRCVYHGLNLLAEGGLEQLLEQHRRGLWRRPGRARNGLLYPLAPQSLQRIAEAAGFEVEALHSDPVDGDFVARLRR